MEMETVILSAVRTPIGAFQGALKEYSAPQLGAICVRESVKRAKVSLSAIDECLMGCVLTGGLGQAPARQAALFAELPNTVGCTTVNRVCGSGVKTLMLGAQAIQCGDAQVVVAGGMESMTRAPYLLDKAREGYRMGPGKLTDSLILDGLWDVYHNFHMGNAAELCAKEKDFSREIQDEYAKQSYLRAQNAVANRLFANEIVPVEVRMGKEKKLLDSDEGPQKAKLDRLGELRPAFDPKGTITAANASSLSDGASALVLCSRQYADQTKLRPLARVVAQASHAQAPEWFTTAPVGAIQKLLEKAKLSVKDIDLFEINEAFAVVSLACIKELGLSPEKVNLRGGAVALGHPIGASGARIVTTLLHALIAEKKRYGIATLCIGGGEASALLIEVLH